MMSSYLSAPTEGSLFPAGFPGTRLPRLRDDVLVSVRPHGGFPVPGRLSRNSSSRCCRSGRAGSHRCNRGRLQLLQGWRWSFLWRSCLVRRTCHHPVRHWNWLRLWFRLLHCSHSSPHLLLLQPHHLLLLLLHPLLLLPSSLGLPLCLLVYH